MESQEETRLYIILSKQNEIIKSHNSVCDAISTLTDVISQVEMRITSLEEMTGTNHEERIQKLFEITATLKAAIECIEEKQTQASSD